MQVAVCVKIFDARYFALVVMQDTRDMCPFSDFQVACGFACGDVCIGGRPFRAPFAPLETEAGLLTRQSPITVLGIDRHAPGMDLFIAQSLGAFFKHKVVVVPRQTFTAACARHAKLVFGLCVPGVHFSAINRPIQKRRALDISVIRGRFPFMVLKPQGRASPVCGCAANRFHDPGG